jgi:uncharacterized membrane protein SpoIIM required for sporulation
VILDLERFIREEEPHWRALDALLAHLEERFGEPLAHEDAKRLYYLYRRATSDLARIKTFAAEPELRGYLERLVARAYTEIHETRDRPYRLHPVEWFFVTLPQTFRRRFRAFAVALAVTMVGIGFGVGAVALDSEAKAVIMPFSHVQDDPAKRVAEEENRTKDRMADHKSSFAAMLMTHNTKVGIMTMAFGLTWGIGSIVLLFYNGVILGAVALDYIRAGQTTFLFGWLLPHGVIEIPAILVAGQAGLVLAAALIGRGDAAPLRKRLRDCVPDMVTLIFGVAVFLIWAGIVESFFSQYHKPVLPYSLKIAFGLLEFTMLVVFLGWSGRGAKETGKPS